MQDILVETSQKSCKITIFSLNTEIKWAKSWFYYIFILFIMGDCNLYNVHFRRLLCEINWITAQSSRDYCASIRRRQWTSTQVVKLFC
jgi:hypothetical protein